MECLEFEPHEDYGRKLILMCSIENCNGDGWIAP